MTESTTKATSTTAAAAAANTPDFYTLLEQAVKEPGQLADAHRHFRQYSLLNRWLASTQLRAAGLPLSPINTFKGWLNLGRPVSKGQKAAVALVMPVPVKKKKEDDDEAEKVFTKFMLRSYWFHLGQTEGEEYQPAETQEQEWGLTAALEFFEVKEVPFIFEGVGDTERQGEVSGRNISVSPLYPHQVLGRVKQLAKVVLGHTEGVPPKGVPTDESTKAVEADATAYLVAATLAFPGLEELRAQLQLKLDGSRIPAKCAHRAFSAADKIINAGYC